MTSFSDQVLGKRDESKPSLKVSLSGGDSAFVLRTVCQLFSSKVQTACFLITSFQIGAAVPFFPSKPFHRICSNSEPAFVDDLSFVTSQGSLPAPNQESSSPETSRVSAIVLRIHCPFSFCDLPALNFSLRASFQQRARPCCIANLLLKRARCLLFANCSARQTRC